MFGNMYSHLCPFPLYMDIVAVVTHPWCQYKQNIGELIRCEYRKVLLANSSCIGFVPGGIYYLLSTLLFQPQTPLLLRGRRLSGSWRGSVLSRFSVGFWSVFVIFDQNWPKTDQESTQSRPLARCSIGVYCFWGVTVCGWNKSVESFTLTDSFGSGYHRHVFHVANGS